MMNHLVESFGEKSVIVYFQDQNPINYLTQLKELLPEAQIRPGLKSILFTFSQIDDYRDQVESALLKCSPKPISRSQKEFIVSVKYDGADLDSVAKDMGISTHTLIELHQSTIWQVALIGFAPGFPYLLPVTAASKFEAVSRLASPRPNVPAGAIGLAAGMSCIYPTAMPGGWQLIGRTNLVLFDLSRDDNPGLLAAGDLIRFQAE